MKKKIASTIAYFRLFDYVPSSTEVAKFLHTSRWVKQKEVLNFLRLQPKKLVPTLRQRQKKQISLQKMKLAADAAKKISFLPSLLLIGVSGNLALLNAEEEDDIDFFIVTAAGTIWITKFLTSLILMFFGLKRGNGNVSNKICLNMFLDEDHLILLKKNIYTAHELAQLKIIYDPRGLYHKLLKQNVWVRKYLANFFVQNLQRPIITFKKTNLGLEFFRLLEPFFRMFQQWRIKKKITTEIVQDGILMFHPNDQTKKILASLKKAQAKDIIMKKL